MIRPRSQLVIDLANAALRIQAVSAQAHAMPDDGIDEPQWVEMANKVLAVAENLEALASELADCG